jgi:hypothetical protein
MNKTTPRTNAFAKKIGRILAKLTNQDIHLTEAAEQAQELIDQEVGAMEKELTSPKKRLSFHEAIQRLSIDTEVAREAMRRDYPVGSAITYRMGSRLVVAEVVEHHDWMIGMNVRGVNSNKTYRLDPHRITSCCDQSSLR